MAATEPITLFISYRSLDSAKVDALVSHLQSLKDSNGRPRYQIWQDKFGIPPGKDWWEAIVDAIIACDVFVFMVSRESVQNINCQAELHYARKRNRPILPLVLDGEFTFNPVTGKDDIDYWQHVPEDLTDGRLQFLFYEGTSFVQKLDTAITNIRRDGQRWQDIPADRPPDPRPATEANSDSVALYDQACDYAFRAEFDTAEKLFRRLMAATDSGFNSEAREWVLILVEYGKLLRLDARETTRYRVQAAWPDYAKRFPLPFLEFFDPKGIQPRPKASSGIVTPPPAPAYVPPPATPTPKRVSPTTAKSQTQQSTSTTKGSRSSLFPVLSVVVVLLVVAGIVGLNSGVFGRSSATSTPTDAPIATAEVALLATAAPTQRGVAPTMAPTRSAVIPTKLATASANSKVLAAGTERTDSFGIKQVYVPAGCFKMGSDPVKDTNANKDEQPQHQVCITKAYWLDEFDVTNAAFDAFVKAGGYTNDSLWSADGLSWKQSSKITWPDTTCTQYSSQPNQPRVCVSYYEAEAYAKWRGDRLPTEAEWEYAARGSTGWIYPWGDTFDQSKANTTENKIGKTTAVDAYPTGKSWVGAYDMAGNVWQWVSDWYSDTYYSTSPTNDPTGPSSGKYRGLRCGSFYVNLSLARSADRNFNNPNNRVNYFGFRLVVAVPG